ncbi:MAG: DNRLRE domain-containing protein, partial [Nitrososphaerota archaeon]
AYMNFANILLGIIILTNFVLLSSYEIFGEQPTTVKISPTDDAHVLADLNDPVDKNGLMQINTGNQEAIELLSSWNVTENQNAFVTIGYLKFDLTKQNINKLEKAELKMLTKDVVLSETPKNVVLLHASNNNWKESDITYLKRPTFSTTITSSTEISTINTWYSWDVTELIRQNPASELSVALIFETGRDNTQDYVSFYSKEASNSGLAPFLELTFVPESEFTFVDSAELGNISLYAGIAIVVGGLVVGFFISKWRGKAKEAKKQGTKEKQMMMDRNILTLEQLEGKVISSINIKAMQGQFDEFSTPELNLVYESLTRQWRASITEEQTTILRILHVELLKRNAPK